jgi:hypothetical protein
LTDALQIYPITQAQWDLAFNSPHILHVSPTDVEPGDTVFVTGANFTPGTDKIFFDGVQQPDATASVDTTTTAHFTVPLDTEGGTHPIVLRPGGATARRSNRVFVRVIPKVTSLSPQPRWTENAIGTINGLAFSAGCQVTAEDWSVSPHPAFNLNVLTTSRTTLTVQVPGPPMGAMRGVRRIIVRNPDGGTNRAGTVARFSDTIVVNVAAFRVLGTTPGEGTTRSAADITNLFTEGAPNSISLPWQQGRVVFRLVQPVTDVTTADDHAHIWPRTDRPAAITLLETVGSVPGALNYFFVRDVNGATAFCFLGGGPAFIGDNAGKLNLDQLMRIVAHETGHGLCLQHVCQGGTDPAGTPTFFGRDCQGGDSAFLMFPFWDNQTGAQIPPGQVDAARGGATQLEEGKTSPMPLADMFGRGGNHCAGADTQN